MTIRSNEPIDDERRRRARRGLLVALVASALTLTGCGGSDAGGDADDASSTATSDAASSDDAGDESTAEDPATEDDRSNEEIIEDMADDLEERQEQQGGGGATLTIGDESWTFDSVLCAIGEEQTGQEGAEFVLSALGDGLQLYVSIDSFGHLVSIDDISDFENPSLGWANSSGGEVIEVDGTSISVDTAFDDTVNGSATDVPGTLEASCP